MKVLVIDNYDSFVYNLAQYVGELGGDPIVHRNDKISIKQIRRMKPSRIILSPGPGVPEDPRYFGVCAAILQRISNKVPTLGVCLGHQGIISTFGGRVKRAGRLMHGKTSPVKHNEKGVFKGVPNPIEATRYHSLVGDKASLPTCLEITAESMDDSEIMGIRHRHYPIDGVQFHPESILTKEGKKIIKNFLDGGEAFD